MTTVSPQERMNEDVSIRELLEGVWSGRRYVLGAVLACGALGAAYGLVVPAKYKASTTLAAVADSSSKLSGTASSLLSQYGDIASLVGLSASGDGKKSESIAVLQSEALTERYLAQNNLIPVLYSSRWDTERNTWKTGREVPTLWKATRIFRRNIRSVTLDSKTGLVTLQITWKDPVLAAKWANGLVELTNSFLRDKAIQESERNIQYLEDQAQRTNAVEVKNAIYSTLESELKKEMAARGSAEYALRIVDPAIAPELPASFEPWLLALFGGAFGFIVSAPLAIALSRSAQTRSQDRS